MAVARGWESKSVEAQMEEAIAAKSAKVSAALTPEELQRQKRMADLTLSRSRVLQQLERSTNQRYTELLRRALAELDRQIAGLAS